MAPDDEQAPPELPLHVIEGILLRLPPAAAAWSGRLVSRDAARLLRHATVVSAREPELPAWVLARMFEDADACQRAKLLECRAAAGDLPGVQMLRVAGCPWSSHACCAAAEHGHLAVLQWLRSTNPPCPLDTGLAAFAAAAAGQQHVLTWLFAKYRMTPFDLGLCVEAAAAAGHVATLAWLIDSAEPGSPIAAQAGLAVGEAAVATQRQQLQQVLSFARARTPPAVLGRA